MSDSAAAVLANDINVVYVPNQRICTFGEWPNNERSTVTIMARSDKPHQVGAAACVFPDCVEPVTEQLELPLCDRHCIKVYRSMQVLLDVTAKHVSPPTALQVAQANLTARRSDTA